MLASGTSAKTVAETVGLSAGQISRHKRHAFAPMSEAQELELWSSRADQLYLQAGVNGQVREQCQALAAGLRGLEFRLRRREELQSESPDLSNLPADFRAWPSAAVSVVRQYLDNVIKTVQLPDSLWAHAPERKIIARVPLPIRR